MSNRARIIPSSDQRNGRRDEIPYRGMLVRDVFWVFIDGRNLHRQTLANSYLPAAALFVAAMLPVAALGQAAVGTAPPNQPPTPGVTGDWSGYRTKLAGEGLTIAAGIYYDYSKNLQGGLSTARSANRELFDLDVTFTTDQTLGWHGGTFFFNLLNHEGTDVSLRLVGDAQGFDNQDGPSSTQIYQLFFQQKFAADTLRFKIGRIDSTTDFAYTANGSAFLGSAFGYSPALTSFPTYPDPAFGAALFWTPGDHWYLTGGASYANRSDRLGILSGEPYIVRAANGGVLFIGEAGAKWTLGPTNLAGRLALGAYTHTGTFPRFDGTKQTGVNGTYGVFDQSLWQVHPPPGGGASPAGIGVFAQFGLTDAHVNSIDEHLGAGVQWTGPIPSAARSNDVLGLGASLVQLSDKGPFVEHRELAVEGFYKIQITPWFNVQPDLQYIVHPGGKGLGDALVATIRVELDF